MRILTETGQIAGHLRVPVFQVRCERGMAKQVWGGQFSINLAAWKAAVVAGGRVLEVVDVPKDRVYRGPLLVGGVAETPNGWRYLVEMKGLERVNDG